MGLGCLEEWRTDVKIACSHWKAFFPQEIASVNWEKHMPPFLGNMTAASGLPKQQQFNRLGGSSCSHPVPFLSVSFRPCPDYPFAFWFIYLFIYFSTIPKFPNSPQLWNFFWGTLHILGDRLVSTRWCLSWGLSPALIPSLGNCSGVSGDHPSPSPGLPPISWKARVVEWGPLGKTATVFFTLAVLPCRGPSWLAVWIAEIPS